MKPCKHLIIAILSLAMSHMALAENTTLDRVSVQINEGIVLESEITNMVKTVKANATAAGQSLPSDQALRT